MAPWKCLSHLSFAWPPLRSLLFLAWIVAVPLIGLTVTIPVSSLTMFHSSLHVISSYLTKMIKPCSTASQKDLLGPNSFCSKVQTP